MSRNQIVNEFGMFGTNVSDSTKLQVTPFGITTTTNGLATISMKDGIDSLFVNSAGLNIGVVNRTGLAQTFDVENGKVSSKVCNDPVKSAAGANANIVDVVGEDGGYFSVDLRAGAEPTGKLVRAGAGIEETLVTTFPAEHPEDVITILYGIANRGHPRIPKHVAYIMAPGFDPQQVRCCPGSPTTVHTIRCVPMRDMRYVCVLVASGEGLGVLILDRHCTADYQAVCQIECRMPARLLDRTNRIISAALTIGQDGSEVYAVVHDTLLGLVSWHIEVPRFVTSADDEPRMMTVEPCEDLTADDLSGGGIRRIGWNPCTCGQAMSVLMDGSVEYIRQD